MGKYASDKVNSLNETNITPDQPLKHRKIISITENGVNYRVNVENDADSVIYPIDGVAIKDGLRCDKFLAILKNDDGIAIFIELKGQKIAHAIEQLEATLTNPLFRPCPGKNDHVRARIVSGGSAGPNSPSNIAFERARTKFRQHYNVELKRLKNQQFDDPINF